VRAKRPIGIIQHSMRICALLATQRCTSHWLDHRKNPSIAISVFFLYPNETNEKKKINPLDTLTININTFQSLLEAHNEINTNCHTATQPIANSHKQEIKRKKNRI